MARVAIVTGGTRGIGRAISEALKADGMTVVANYAGNAEKARAFVKAAQGAVTLLQVRPDLYAGLTIEELGYSPKAQRGGRVAP